MARPPIAVIASVAFVNMLTVGTLYGISTIQAELPRLFPQISPSQSLAPFAVAYFGLSIGTRVGAALTTRLGSHAATASGTALWAIALATTRHFLQRNLFTAYSSLSALFAAVILGGIGVGITYLAVIVMVGQGLPDQPLARSAIGPLGFSSGSAICIALSRYISFKTLDAEQLGHIVCAGGLISAAVALITVVVLPFNAKTSTEEVPAEATRSQSALSFLLFINAFPGMAVFWTLLPAAALYGDTTHYFLSSGMAFLALGGIIALSIYSVLGTRFTFASIFALRGLLLVLLPRSTGSSDPAVSSIALWTVLFAHGVGFSVLPIMVKSQCTSMASFYTTYARILPAWGAAGLFGALYQSAWLSTTGSTDGSWLYIGILAASASVTILMFPFAAFKS